MPKARTKKSVPPAIAPAGRDGEFGFDPAVAVAHLREADKPLARVIDAAGPFTMRLRTTPSIFVALAESIVHQQLNGKAAATIYGRLCGLFPGTPDAPDPALLLGLPDEALRGAGLSTSKTLALRDLARKTLDTDIPALADIHAMENEAIIERLITVRGIGRWTVEMLLMSRLGRPDVLPVDDFGVRKGFMLAYGKKEMPTRQELSKRAERWRPYRSVASWYMWRAVDLTKAPPSS